MKDGVLEVEFSTTHIESVRRIKEAFTVSLMALVSVPCNNDMVNFCVVRYEVL